MISKCAECLKTMLAGSLFFVLSQAAICATNAPHSSHQVESSSIQVIETCTHIGRMTAAEIAIVNNRVMSRVTCVNDRSGKSKEESKAGSRAFPVSDAKMRSVYAIETTANFIVNISIDSSGQTAEIKHSDGRPCFVIAATTKSKNPVPRAFTSSSNDWRSAIDYMTDEKCSAIAIRLGNQLAIVPNQSAHTLDLYKLTFKIMSR